MPSDITALLLRGEISFYFVGFKSTLADTGGEFANKILDGELFFKNTF